MVFYRPGGRHAFVSRHVSNPLIPAIAIQRILKKLGISVAEWVRGRLNDQRSPITDISAAVAGRELRMRFRLRYVDLVVVFASS
jgi:hypothetical protein